MANNWTTKTLADYPAATSFYANVTGDDTPITGGDGSPDNPFRTITKASLESPGYGRQIVWGTGTHTGSISSVQDSIAGEFGKARQSILNLNGGSLGINNATGTILQDLTIKNGSVDLSIIIPIVSAINRVTFIDCTINNSYDINSYFQIFTDCEFINCQISTTTRMVLEYIRCKFFNTTSYNQKNISAGFGCRKLESCYVDSFSKIEFSSVANITEINFNDIEGQLMFQDGTNPDVYLTLAQALIDYPTKVGSKNIDEGPMFADISKLALVVDNASPLLGTSKTGGNIGNAKRGTFYAAGISPELTPIGGGGTAVFTNLVGTSDLTVDPVFDTGESLSGVCVHNSSQIQLLGPLVYIGKYALDSSLGGLANSQVPDNFDYSSGTAGDNPENLTYELRFSTGNTPPVVDADFDNAGWITAGDFFTFVWNIQPRVDGAFLGNGDPAYNSASSFPVGVKWFQVKNRIIKSLWNSI